MMTMLANLKISKKLSLLLGVSVTALLLLGGISFWALSSLHSSAAVLAEEMDRTADAHQITGNINRSSMLIGHQALQKNCSSCHDNISSPTGDLTSRKAYIAQLQELKARDTSAEGQRLIAQFEAAAAQWRSGNNRTLDLARAGKQAEAVALFRENSVTGFKPVGEALENFTRYQADRVKKVEAEAKQTWDRTMLLVPLLLLASIAFAVFFGSIISRTINKPLSAAVAQIGEVAKGNIREQKDSEFLRRQDEFGDMARAVETMSENLRGMIQDIAGGVQILSASSAELSASASQITSGSRHTSDKAHSVAAASEEMSANAASVAAGMEQTASNLANVTASTEQMTSTISEIAANSEKARQITGEANRQAGRISEQMNQLGQAAHEIGKVTETITEISSQTNLLALNATIEAARAGAAGKGFAVVANEIKELAQQTAGATEDIKARIAGVQSSASAGIAEIDKVSKVIHDVSDIVSSIAAAIEEQATVTRDIARNISEASHGVSDVNMRVSQTSSASQEIARDISGVDQVAREMTEGSTQVQASATSLSQMAEQLKGVVARFHI
jgi:methyl-accepting chemotaxis protein